MYSRAKHWKCYMHLNHRHDNVNVYATSVSRCHSRLTRLCGLQPYTIYFDYNTRRLYVCVLLCAILPQVLLMQFWEWNYLNAEWFLNVTHCKRRLYVITNIDSIMVEWTNKSLIHLTGQKTCRTFTNRPYVLCTVRVRDLITGTSCKTSHTLLGHDFWQFWNVL